MQPISHKQSLKNFKEIELEESWINAMQEEVDQFERNKAQILVPRTTNYPIISAKWVISKLYC